MLYQEGMTMFEDEGFSDCEVGEREWLDEQDVLRVRDEKIEDEVDREVEFERLVDEELQQNRLQPVPGMTLNGKPVMQDVETGEIVGINSCDALRIIDGVN